MADDLPRLVTELYQATPDRPGRGGTTTPGAPAHARWLLSPIRVLVTSDPARLRRDAHKLLALADALELVQLDGHVGQQTLEVGP